LDVQEKRIAQWKRFLQSKGLCGAVPSDLEFKSGMRKLEGLLSEHCSSIKGMIWRNGKINPNATVADVDSALNLIAKFGQATLDDLGDPSDPDRLSGTPMNSMFISQEDSKSDEWSPGNNQNQGREGSTTPKNLSSSGKNQAQKTPEKPQKSTNINERMKQMINLIENMKK
jgi:hypothetical protein